MLDLLSDSFVLAAECTAVVALGGLAIALLPWTDAELDAASGALSALWASLRGSPAPRPAERPTAPGSPRLAGPPRARRTTRRRPTPRPTTGLAALSHPPLPDLPEGPRGRGIAPRPLPPSRASSLHPALPR